MSARHGLAAMPFIATAGPFIARCVALKNAECAPLA
jgi:hypothetical protein